LFPGRSYYFHQLFQGGIGNTPSTTPARTRCLKKLSDTNSKQEPEGRKGKDEVSDRATNLSFAGGTGRSGSLDPNVSVHTLFTSRRWFAAITECYILSRKPWDGRVIISLTRVDGCGNVGAGLTIKGKATRWFIVFSPNRLERIEADGRSNGDLRAAQGRNLTSMAPTNGNPIDPHYE